MQERLLKPQILIEKGETTLSVRNVVKYYLIKISVPMLQKVKWKRIRKPENKNLFVIIFQWLNFMFKQKANLLFFNCLFEHIDNKRKQK